MTPQEQWQRNNDEYVAAAVEWLRLRLTDLASKNPPPERGNRHRGLLEFLVGGREDPPPPRRVKAPGEKEIAKARAAMDDLAKADPAPAAILLQQRFALSQFELEIVLLCAALELDTRIAALCAQAHNEPSKAYPTYALALALLPDPEWGALSPERSLR